jgi:hypothetical protein
MEPEQDTGDVVVHRVLTEFQPNQCVSFISHFAGVTMQSRVQFREWEFIGIFSRIVQYPLKAAVERGGRVLYEDLKRECEQSGTHKERRSTRVPLRVKVETQGIEEPVACEGETLIVNCHGALISTVVALRVGMKVDLRVIPTERRALADVVHVDPEQPRFCGVGLVSPENIWGVSSPPPDWLAGNATSASQ